MENLNKKFDEILENIEKCESKFREYTISKLYEAKFWTDICLTEEDAELLNLKDTEYEEKIEEDKNNTEKDK